MTSLQTIIANNAEAVDAVVNHGADLADYDELYEELFAYFCYSGKMPYGIAKAHDGDPFEWITNYLNNCYPG